MYTIVHHYLTVGDDGTVVVEHESSSWSGDDPDDIAASVRQMIANPGGRSGTTVSLVVSLTQPTNI